MNKKYGFVLIELIIVIAIMVFLLGAVIVSYRSFEKRTELENTARNILITLELAQNKTLASENDSQYGVHFESDKYILFKGDAYESGSPDNEINQLSNRLEIYNINLTGSGSDIIFQRINGNTNQDGIIDLRLISDPEKTKSIDINSFGQIE
ncbi:MAG: type II secretion system protein, partial [Patescibacteria group bacterium]